MHDTDVDKFLDAMTRQKKFPFSTPELRDELKHTLWILNRVASAKALAKKLKLHGCAPTEIIYRICLRYILGFSDEIHIEKNNIRLCDTLEYAKNGTMDAEMRKLFDL